MANTQPARGMRDFLPADVRRRDYVIGIVKEVYERYGFEPPAVVVPRLGPGEERTREADVYLIRHAAPYRASEPA